MEAQEIKALICMPISFDGYVVPGSLPDKCSKCGQPIWVSPSSLLILHDNPGMETLCKTCDLAQMEEGELPDTEERLTPAQVDEIQEWLDSR